MRAGEENQDELPAGGDYFRWSELLTSLNRVMLQDPEVLAELPAVVRRRGWLGYPGATETQLWEAEARLGIALPPSYLAFLRLSNGWRQCGPYLSRFSPVEAVGWLHEARRPRRLASLGRGLGPPGAGLDWSVEVAALRPWGQGLAHALLVNGLAGGYDVLYLLHPDARSHDGEWQASYQIRWSDRPERFPSLRHLLQALLDRHDQLKLRRSRDLREERTVPSR